MRDEPQFEGVREDAGIQGYEPAFVDVGGVRTRYYDVGSGEPIVLVHGGNWSGQASANRWTAAFEHLRESFRVIAFDRIGCGMTDNPAGPEDFRYGTELDHAMGVLDALGLDSCHLVGYSRGAGLASRMAVEDSDRFEALVLTNTATLGPPVGDEGFRHRRLFDLGDRGLEPTDPAYTRHWLEQYSYRTEYVDDERCRAAAYMASRSKARRTAAVMDEQGQYSNWTDSLETHMEHTRRRIREGAVSMPVLYLYGREDMTVPTEMALGAFEMFSRGEFPARLTTLDDCGHMVFLEYPAEFSRLVGDFVDFHCEA